MIMVNHGRTLLMNLNGSERLDSDFLGEEYVPLNYTALRLPQHLNNARNLLFGPGADRAMINYRLKQYMTVLHSTELGDYLYDLDPRITYTTNTSEVLFSNSTYDFDATLMSGSDTWTLHLIKPATSTKSSWRLLDRWNVTVQSVTSIKIDHLLSPVTSTTTSYTNASGVSSLISLPGSDYQLLLGMSSSVSYPIWRLDILSKPLLDLPEIMGMLRAGLAHDSELLFPNVEPYSTFYKLWSMNVAPMTYQLSGLLLAVIYQIDSIYKTGS